MSVSTDWWSRFFTGPVVEFWRRAMPPEHTAAEAVFLESVLELRPGSEVEYRFIRDGKVDIRIASSRIHTCLEVVRLLERAGFRDVECFGSIDRKPFELGSRTLIVTATRA